MFSLESFEKTSGGTSSRHMWRMYANVSSVDFSPSARKGFSNSDSHFDREARECSSFSSKNFVEVNLLLTSSKASSPIGTLIVSTLWPLFLCRSGFEQRSEEHTSELQSRENLVCRLLLEKKKIMHIIK